VCVTGRNLYSTIKIELDLEMLKDDRLLLQGLRDTIRVSKYQLKIDRINRRKYNQAKSYAWFNIVCGFLLIGLTVTLLLVDAGVIPNVNPFL